jgi:carbon-monoxide dehydrogenase iron sulfur subunit
MAKVLFINYEKCTGCRQCELVCSVQHTGASNPTRANIHVVKWEDEGFYLPVFCQQCVDAPCLNVCPKKAISREAESGRVTIDYDLCIGCRACMLACPFGAMGFDPVDKKVIKCDLCDGDPLCARFCETSAIEFVEATTAQYGKMREAGKNFASLILRAHGE